MALVAFLREQRPDRVGAEHAQAIVDEHDDTPR
jgi:hypothetical protein